jgi:hypothetical protein
MHSLEYVPQVPAGQLVVNYACKRIIGGNTTSFTQLQRRVLVLFESIPQCIALLLQASIPSISQVCKQKL